MYENQHYSLLYNFGNIPSNVPFNTSYIIIRTTGSNVPSTRFEQHPMLPQNNTLVLRNLTTASTTHSQNLGESSVKGKKRIINGPPKVVIERRQRKMLKNKKSAARSQARRFFSHHKLLFLIHLIHMFATY